MGARRSVILDPTVCSFDKDREMLPRPTRRRATPAPTLAPPPSLHDGLLLVPDQARRAFDDGPIPEEREAVRVRRRHPGRGQPEVGRATGTDTRRDVMVYCTLPSSTSRGGGI